MSVPSVPSSPIIPTDFAAFLQSPEGVAAIQNAYTPPSVVSDAVAHNKTIIQAVFRLQVSTYVIPAAVFNTVSEQQIWKTALLQAHAPGMPALKSRPPLSAISSWIDPVLSPATATALDWARADSESWYLKFPSSARPSEPTDAYALSLRLDMSAQPPPLFAVSMLTDPLLFQEWLASVRRYYGDGHLQPLDVILGDHARALFSMISILKYPSLAIPIPDPRLQWGCILMDQKIKMTNDLSKIIAKLEALSMPASRFINMKHFDTFSTSALLLAIKWDTFLLDIPSKKWRAALVQCLCTKRARDWVDIELPAKDFTSILLFIERLIAHRETFAAMEPDPVPPRAATSPPTRTKVEGRLANLAHVEKPPQPYRDPTMAQGGCFNPGCPVNNHRIRQCNSPCKLSDCPSPSRPHMARSCDLLYGEDAGPYFATATVRSISRPPCHTSPPKTKFSLAVFRSLRPLGPESKSPCPLAAAVTISSALPSNSPCFPVIRFDTGANLAVSPVPISLAPVIPVSESLNTAQGSSVAITGCSTLGNSTLYIAPALTDALLPQEFIESQGCMSVLVDKKLLLFDILNNNNSKLLNTITSAIPLATVDGSSGEYILPKAVLDSLVCNTTVSNSDMAYAHRMVRRCNQARINASRSSFRTQTGRLSQNRHLSAAHRASSARYYTVTFNSLRDVVLYWHFALGHASEEKMISIVEHNLVRNLPFQLTTAVIRKYFKQLPRCKPCAEATLQQLASPPSAESPRPAIGTHWYLDFDKQSGSDDPALAIPSIAGFTHVLNAIDAGSDRLVSYPARGTKSVVQYFRKLHDFNVASGYTMTHIHVDSEFYRSHALKTECRLRRVKIVRSIPYDHGSIGLIERANRTCSEGRAKRMLDRPHIKPSYWLSAYADAVDMFNLSPHPSNPHSSPYILYDKVYPDALASPFLTWGTLVTGHIPNELQTTHSGRGTEYIYFGRSPDSRGGIDLLNVATNRIITRRTFRVMNDHPVSNALHSRPLDLFFDDSPDADPVHPPPPIQQGVDVIPPLAALHPTVLPPATPAAAAAPILALQYTVLYPATVHHSRRRLFDRINTTFSELNDHGATIAQWTVDAVVESESQTYYRYYDSFEPRPADPDSFEYSLCSTINAQIWSIWDPTSPAAPIAAVRSVSLSSADCPTTTLLANSPPDDFATAASDLSPIISTNCNTHMYTIPTPEIYLDHGGENKHHLAEIKNFSNYNCNYVTSAGDFSFNQSFGSTPLMDNANCHMSPKLSDLQFFHAATAIHNDFVKLPKTWSQMMVHPNHAELYDAFLVEWNRWMDRSVIIPLTKDPKDIDPALIGDLMIIWDIKYLPDNSGIDKWKCRIVFRGDLWKNFFGMETYASSLDSKALLILISHAASQDLDLWALDVSTAFLYGTFPEGTHQYARRPHGVPGDFFPPVLELGSCVYGHPAASQRFELHNQGVYDQIGFERLRSTPSVFQIKETSTTDSVISGVITDDCTFIHKFGSPMKQFLLDAFAKHYKYTVKDPLVNFNGLTLTRDRANLRIGITQPLFLANIRSKYPILSGQSAPRVPYPYNDYLTAQDRLDQQVFLLSKLELKAFRSVLGEIIWLQRFSKPELLFAQQMLSRCTHPTLYDLNLGIAALQYAAFTTPDLQRWLGGPLGSTITTTVDTSFASLPNSKSQSAWSVHVGGGGAAIFTGHAQTITCSSSTDAEATGDYMALPDTIYVDNILTELGFPQPTAIGIGNDNQSTIKICNNYSNGGHTRHLSLRFSIVRDNIERGITRMFYLPTERMIADIGTKALSPAVFERLRDFLLGHIMLPDFIEYIEKFAPDLLIQHPTYNLDKKDL